MMQARDRMRDLSKDDYVYYMSRGCGGGYERGRERERRGRSRSTSDSVANERGEYDWDWESGEGESSGRVRSRSPQRSYYEGKGLARGNELDVEFGHSCRNKSSPPPFHPIERYEPASPVRSSCSIDMCKYGYPTAHAALNEYIPGHIKKVVVSDDNVVHESVEDSRMVRRHQGVLPVSSYMETSRHFHPGSSTSNRTVDKRNQHGSYSRMDRALNIGAYNEDSHLPCSRDTSYPLSSKSQKNLYASTSRAFRDGGRISSRCQVVPHIFCDDICENKSVVSERSVFDANEGQPTYYSTSDHLNNARSSSHHLKSTNDSIQRLNYHYPTFRSRENGELGHLSDREYRNACTGFSQIHIEEAPRIGGEVNEFLPDEDYGTLNQHTRQGCYTAHFPLSITNENEESYTPDCSFKDCHFSHRLSHDRDVHSDTHSCLSIQESVLYCGMDHDYEDPHFITPFHDHSGRMTAETCMDNYRTREEKIDCINSRADLIFNADETSGGLSETGYWKSSIHNKQDCEQYYYTSATVSSTEPKDNHVDAGMHYPDISSDKKQYGDRFDLPALKKEHCNERFSCRDSKMGSICTKYALVYDVNVTSEYGMPVGRIDADRQRWEDDGPKVPGAPGEMLDANAVTYMRSSELNSGCRTSYGRCGTSLSRYLPDRREILSEEEMTIGAEHTRRTGSRSIFDRLGSPQRSIDRFPRKQMQGYFNSQKHELKQIKDHRKSDHLALKGFRHSSRRSSYCKQSTSSNTNIDGGNMKLAEDTDTLKYVDVPFNPSSYNNNGDFKQSIQKAFLLISQKINENPATRMRSNGQGKSGTLFCIVCKRSNSKEFRVARDLAAHSLTCQKAGVRAQHLGLFKAICVTMGWNCDIDQQSGMWTPQILSEEKALAQKEDLICWPPVFIVHNFSLLRKNHTAHKVLTTDELEAFFRRKGFISGKVKVCLGQSTNSHIMVIKFLGTFPGFKDAEKLHEYFAERKCGRVEFWKLANSNAKDLQLCGTSSDSDIAELPDLYGYMGIAEDWGTLDTESKKRCTIKSKQEILDFSTEPILPDAS